MKKLSNIKKLYLLYGMLLISIFSLSVATHNLCNRIEVLEKDMFNLSNQLTAKGCYETEIEIAHEKSDRYYYENKKLKKRLAEMREQRRMYPPGKEQ